MILWSISLDKTYRFVKAQHTYAMPIPSANFPECAWLPSHPKVTFNTWPWISSSGPLQQPKNYLLKNYNFVPFSAFGTQAGHAAIQKTYHLPEVQRAWCAKDLTKNFQPLSLSLCTFKPHYLFCSVFLKPSREKGRGQSRQNGQKREKKKKSQKPSVPKPA